MPLAALLAPLRRWLRLPYGYGYHSHHYTYAAMLPLFSPTLRCCRYDVDIDAADVFAADAAAVYAR